MTELNRVYRLTVIRGPEKRGTVNFDRSFFEDVETLTEITEHRIEFKVEKHLKKQPNTAELVITNLAQGTRDEFERGPTKVVIQAGYGSTPRLLFIGDVRYASHEHEGTEWRTKLQLADGGRAYANARINRSYAAGTPVSTMIGDLAKAFGLPLPSDLANDSALKARIPTGESLTGYVADEIDRLLAAYGFEWSFQNGRLQILRFDAVKPGTIRVIRQATEDDPDGGMIGTPTVDPPRIVAPSKKPSKKVRVPKVTVRHLLYPEITPGEQIGIQSRSLSGGFRVDTVVHEGDSESGDWVTTVEAVAV